MIHTPVKKTTTVQGQAKATSRSPEGAGPSVAGVRRSIDLSEAEKVLHHAQSPTNPKNDAAPLTARESSDSLGIRRLSVDAPSPVGTAKTKYANRTAEARACLNKAKLHLGNSRNLKTVIKTEVLDAINRLFELVKESEKDKIPVASSPVPISTEKSPSTNSECIDIQKELIKTIQDHTSLIRENTEKMERLQNTLAAMEKIGEKTYASVAGVRCGQTGGQTLERATLHSVVVSSTEEMDTGEEVLEKVRKLVNAKEGWVQIEKVRKAKDRKVIMGCRTKEERSKIKARIEAVGENLVVEEVINRDPLLILKDVLLVHSDEDVIKALRNQNREIFYDLGDEENRVSIKFRRKTRNPHMNHVVLSVSPTIWRRAIEGGKLRIDLQRVQVEDQSPLVQCTRCLGYGHGKRFCKEPADLCSHCGGPHFRADCPDRHIGEAAACVNCTRVKLGNTQHNAFSSECPVRKKWDALARASIAYC